MACRLMFSIIVGCLVVMMNSPVRGELVFEWDRRYFDRFTVASGLQIAADDLGNVFFVGNTSASQGNIKSILIKYDRDGTEIWSQELGTDGSVVSFGLTVDQTGNPYITGTTYGSLGGPHVGRSDAFLAKYNGSGTLQWIDQMGTLYSNFSNTVAVSVSGEIYTGGNTFGDFLDPYVSADEILDFDSYIAKHAADGTRLWVQQFGGEIWDEVQAIAVDREGNAFASGNSSDRLGTGHWNSENGFLAKFDLAGNMLWSQILGTTEAVLSNRVGVDSEGNVYVNRDIRDIGPIIAKYNPDGDLLWTQETGTHLGQSDVRIVVDGNGNTYLSGQRRIATEKETFIAKYDTDGDLLWSYDIGDILMKGFAVNGFGDIFVTGSNLGNSFLMKFSQPIPEPAAGAMLLAALGICGSVRPRRSTAPKYED